ncbi:PYD and CARD domain containing, partial [Chelydra serpentina]
KDSRCSRPHAQGTLARLVQDEGSEEKVAAPQMQTFHTVNRGMTRNPMRVRPFQAVLENPSLSPIGLIYISSSLYWAFRATDRPRCLYRIPKNRSAEKAIEEHEKCQSIAVDKPTRTHFGTRHGEPSVSDAVINPADLKCTCIGPGSRQPYTRDMEEGMQLSLPKQKYFTSEREREPLWTAFLRAGDVEHPASVSDPPTGTSTGKTTRDLLVSTLDDLGESELKNFKSKLTDIDLKEGYDHIPRGKLENAKSLEVTDLLIGHYTMFYALEVTMTVLEAINRKDLARRLRSVTRTGQASSWAWPCLLVSQGVTHKYPYSPLLYNYDKFCTVHALRDILKVLIS